MVLNRWAALSAEEHSVAGRAGPSPLLRPICRIAVLHRRNAMKTILSVLVALSVLAGVTGSAQAATFGSTDWWVERSTNMN